MWLVLACNADNPSLVDIEVVMEGVTADLGTVQLDRAELTLSDLRFEAPAATAKHPGHDFAGDVAGELVGSWTVDLLHSGTSLGVGSFYEGRYETARLTLPADPVTTFSGTVTVQGASRPFELALSPDQGVTGIPFEARVRQSPAPAAVRVSFSLKEALSHIDWAIPGSDGDDVLTVADGDLLNTSTFGVTSTLSWSASLEE